MDKNFQNKSNISEIFPIVNIYKKAYTIELHSHAVYELQGFRIIHFLQLFQGILRVYRKAFAFQK